MAQYDLTFQLAAHLDRHLILPLIEFLDELKVYDEKDIQQAKLDVVSGTKMVDTAIAEYQKLKNTQDTPPAMAAQRERIFQELHNVESQVQGLISVLKNPDVDLANQLRASAGRPEQVLRDQNISQQDVETLYAFAKLKYDCGQYGDAMDLLYYYRLMAGDDERKYLAAWGQLSSEILSVVVDGALTNLDVIRDLIDGRVKVPPAEQLQQRTWLVHWSLFVFFNLRREGMERLIDFLSGDERLLNAIQLNCPHILRYITAAVIIVQPDKNGLQDLTRLLKQERSNYKDPLTEFVLALHVDFDFDKAAAQLKECERVFGIDFFLGYVKDDFFAEARTLMFRVMCKVHRVISLSKVAELLNLKTEEKSLEKHVVSLIRQCDVSAKVDSDKNTLVVDAEVPSIYQQVIDRSKELVMRSSDLATLVEKKYYEKLDAQQ